MSLIELETSFKQVFMFQILFKNILDACKPVTQIFQHLDSKSSMKRKSKSYGGASHTDDNDLNQMAASPKSGILLQMHVNSIYFALIKENHTGGAIDPYDDGNQASYMPMLSFEIKWVELRQKTQITGL